MKQSQELKKVLEKYRIYPSKRLGQNFLIDRSAVRKVIEAAELKPEDIVLEIGPGLGALTIELAKRVKKVIAIEKDPKMIEILKKSIKEFKNIKIIKGDILKLPLQISSTIVSQICKKMGYKVVANLPFYLTAPVIRKFLESTGGRPLQVILVVQKEVGQRICAKPPDMNLLAVSVQFYAKPEIISYISKKSFWPQPKVDSAIIKIIPKTQNLQGVAPCKFFKIVRSGFSQPRKQLINNLSRLNFSSKNLSGQAKNPKLNKERVKDWLLENNIQPTQRAETLSINNWINLTKTFKIN